MSGRKDAAGERTPEGLTVLSASRAAVWSRVALLDWLTAEEAAIYCRVSLRTFDRMVAFLPIPFVRPAGPKGDRRFYRALIDAALLARVENNPGA